MRINTKFFLLTILSALSIHGCSCDGVFADTPPPGVIGIKGGTDNTVIGNVGDALKVDVTNSAGSTVTQGPQGNPASPWWVDVVNFPSTQVVSGTVAATQSGTWTVGATISNFPTTFGVTQATSPWVVSGVVGISNFPSIQPVSGTVTAQQGTTPWTISGTVGASQSGSWTVTANAGTNLNTSALALDSSVNNLQVSQGSTTTGQSGTLVQGSTNSTSPSYTSGKTNPLSLTTSGALRTDSSSITQPVSGTITATQSFGANLHVDVDNTVPVTISTPLPVSFSTPVPVSQSTSPWTVNGTVTANIGTTNGLALDATVQNTQGSSSGGTAALKSDLAGGIYLSSLPSLTTGQQSALLLDSSGRLYIRPLTSADTVSAIQSGAWTVAATQSGAWTTGRTWTTSSGTDSISSVQSGTWNVGLNAGSNNIGNIAGEGTAGTPSGGVLSIQGVSGGQTVPVSGSVTANQGTSPWTTEDSSDGPVSPGTAATTSLLAGLQYNSPLPTPTPGQQLALQADASGFLLVDSNSQGSSTGGTAANQSNLVGGVVTSFPYLSPGQQTSLQLDNVGGLIITGEVGGNPVTVVGDGGFMNVNSVINPVQVITPINTPLSVIQNTIGTNFQVSDVSNGPVSPGTAASYSGLAGSVYNSTLPSPSTGQQVALQSDSRGRLLVDGSGATQPISFATPLPTGTNTIGSVNIVGTIPVSISTPLPVTIPTPLPVTGTFWQTTQPVSGSISVLNFPATQPVSGTVTVNQGVPGPSASPWPVTIQTPIPVTGTFYQATQPVSGTFWQSTQPVSGTFWQTTQPVSGTVTANAGSGTFTVSDTTTHTDLATINTTLGSPFQAGGSIGNTTFAATQSGTWNINNISGTISLPTGAATSANQSTEITDLGTIATNTSNTNTSVQNTQGPVSPGAQAAKSDLMGLVYNSPLPTPTPSQQVAAQADSSGRLLVNGAGVTQPVSGTFWQTTQPVSGTFWQTTQPVSIATMPTTPVTGTFWQATQPVSGTFWQTTQPVSGTVTASQATASSLNAQVVGSVASGSADSGNGVKISGVYNTTVPAIANTDRSDLQTDARGALIVTQLDGARQSYSGQVSAPFASASSATDICTLTGSASKTVRVTRVGLSGTKTTSSYVYVQLVKRSAANTSGTTTTTVTGPLDSANAAATATLTAYTANPSLGASVMSLRSVEIPVPVPTPLASNAPPHVLQEWAFGDKESQAVVLRGVAQVLAINLNATTVTGGSWMCYFEWTEE